MKYEIYTDGSCKGNPGKGACAMIVLDKDKHVFFKYAEPHKNTTSNQMELLAVIRALQWVKKESEQDKIKHTCKIFTDSKYTKKIATEWAAMWEARGWKKKGGPIKNLSFVQSLHKLTKEIDVKFKLIPGHVGIRHNEDVDKLASDAAFSQEEHWWRMPVMHDDDDDISDFL